MDASIAMPRRVAANDYLFGRGPAWFAYLMTIGLMAIDYIDRQIIASMFPFLKADWMLTDAQLGALVSVVSVTVAVFGIPVAWIADRFSRVKSIMGMATTWSIATIACMFSQGYAHLLLARAFVGLGEAGYGSVRAAMVSTHFPQRNARRDTGRVLRFGIRQGVELALGFIHRSLQQLLEKSWRSQAVCFTHAPPARKDAHRRFFGTNVEFGHDCNAIVCLAADITFDAIPIHWRRAPTRRDNARECIQALQPSGLCSADRVAKHLGVDRRTLHRHLSREGETFSSLVNSIRSELATHYIDNRERPLASVAELLGFSALSAFSRWFRGRFGCSVSQRRDSLDWGGTAPLPNVVSTPRSKP